MIKILSIAIYIFLAIGLINILLFLGNLCAKVFINLFENLNAGDTYQAEKNIILVEEYQKQNKTNEAELLRMKNQVTELEENYSNELKALARRVNEQDIVDTLIVEEQQVEQQVILPSADELSLATKKQFAHELFNDVLKQYQQQQVTLVQKAIKDFEYIIGKVEARCALPYLVLLRVLDMYSKKEIQKFRRAFTVFYQYWNSVESRRILRNRFLSVEEKFEIINQKINIIQLDKNFSEFLCYILQKYQYKEYGVLYQNFIKCYNVRYETGKVEVTIAKRELQEIFIQNWYYPAHRYQLTFTINPDLIGGIKIKYATQIIDASYQELAIQYLERQNEGKIYE